MKNKTNSRANDIDTNSVEQAYPNDDTTHDLPWDGFDLDRTQVASGVARKVHFGKGKYIC